MQSDAIHSDANSIYSIMRIKPTPVYPCLYTQSHVAPHLVNTPSQPRDRFMMFCTQ